MKKQFVQLKVMCAADRATASATILIDGVQKESKASSGSRPWVDVSATKF